MPTELTIQKQVIAIEQQLKFNYSFSTLIFGTLALSLQFSHEMGKTCPYFLITAWFCFMASSIAGGYILTEMYKVKNMERVFLFDDLSMIFKTAFRIRLWGFLIGLWFNLLFAAINYWNSTYPNN
jgi:hypothetical protein